VRIVGTRAILDTFPLLQIVIIIAHIIRVLTIGSRSKDLCIKLCIKVIRASVVEMRVRGCVSRRSDTSLVTAASASTAGGNYLLAVLLIEVRLTASAVDRVTMGLLLSEIGH
jgi:hypothetical protein